MYKDSFFSLDEQITTAPYTQWPILSVYCTLHSTNFKHTRKGNFLQKLTDNKRMQLYFTWN